MRFLLAFAVAGLTLGEVARAETPAPAAEEIHQAVERSLGFLSKEAVAWVRDRKCGSCHHAPMMMWTLGEARQRGFAIDQEALSEVSAVALKGYAEPKPASPDAKDEDRKLALEVVYLSLARRGDSGEDELHKASGARFVEHFRDKQKSTGLWDTHFTRPPVFDAREVTTLFSLWALTSPGLRETLENQSLKDKALAALQASPAADGNQTLNLRLVLAAEGKQPTEALAPLWDQLFKMQNSDGGFSQTPEMASDAYATGQTLYALAVSGAKPSEAIARAQSYLLSTQQPDGPWSMTSRPFGPEKKVAKDLRPIVYYGSAWATLGLLRTSPPRASANAGTK